MIKSAPVSSIMTSQVISLDINTPLREVVNTMKQYKFRHIPVSKSGELAGIISKSDINRLTFSSMFEGQAEADEAVLELLSLEQVMTANPRTVHADAPIKELAEIFSKEEFHALPVINETGKLVGIVTTTDVIRFMLEQF
jgi:CBS domain-containing protein